MRFQLTNISGKDIDAMKGIIRIYDQFGDPVGTAGLGMKLKTPLERGGLRTEERSWSMVDEEAEVLRSGEGRIEFFATDVFYSDGSREGF